MKRVKNSAFFITAAFLVFTASSCKNDATDITRPMFAVSAPEYKDSKADERCVLGGVYFDFYNRAESCVTYLETRMNVFDRKTQTLAFTGYGTIQSSDEVTVKSGEKKQLCIPLDDYITSVSKEGYYIDQFYVSLIRYEDGSEWKDSFGLYAVSGVE